MLMSGALQLVSREFSCSIPLHISVKLLLLVWQDRPLRPITAHFVTFGIFSGFIHRRFRKEEGRSDRRGHDKHRKPHANISAPNGIRTLNLSVRRKSVDPLPNQGHRSL
jgi:hypothetical protein